MPQFSTDPPQDPRGHGLPLKRCPTYSAITAIVTSTNLVGCPTHFYGGRTVPCEEKECEPCLNGVPWRWHAYCSAWSPTNKIHFLFESTRRACDPFIQYRDAHGLLRGCLFKAQRMNGRPNARVYIETKPADLEKVTLPTAPDLELVLSIIWNIPLPSLTTGDSQRKMPQVRVDQTTPSKQTLRHQLNVIKHNANGEPAIPVPRN